MFHKAICENDKDISMEYYIKSMNCGNIFALNNLGNINENNKNIEHAIYYYCLSAERGYQKAKNNLNNCIINNLNIVPRILIRLYYLENDIKTITEKVDKLHQIIYDMLHYSPDGDGMKEAEEDFYKLAVSQTK